MKSIGEEGVYNLNDVKRSCLGLVGWQNQKLATPQTAVTKMADIQYEWEKANPIATIPETEVEQMKAV